MFNEKVKEMIRELDKYKLQDKWVRFEKLSKNKKINSETFQDEFIIITNGILHVENKKFQILHFFSNGDIINQQVAKISGENELRLVCDTDVSLIFIDREYFLNYATNKPSYMEWLLEETLINNKNLYNELIKYDLSAEERIVYALQYLCDKLEIESENGYQQIPKYINKIKMAKYGKISRKQLNEKIILLLDKEVLKEKKGRFYIKKAA
ncbi:Crp/Fnr family transcriptional regulator [Listeria monocytogenes]|uniref:Crp/Fnr family transcriptional regulator n=3 Tax=Listeria TaxID=1637 RepID=A0AB73HCY2_LISIO|nr:MULTISPECIES: Crp/Fnr family transcriptional regulator [Listeria]EAC3621557.1 Crp/Fnr family transcriptional regulator [Listeria monocytogenes]EAC4438279.1 Crp/Fnr family transcriptional regulator [Listeria monocytogenes]EAC6233955.1 Crp/Fnr family transcriptional regulator [Listeria monocytogenes]EAC6801229.1 Crp/Fnr family transcriptional regulator [Listeria monocytogenes]EAC7152242.1 Crp/Fnr family transcriptional regulator [Listeria monocytogenes]